MPVAIDGRAVDRRWLVLDTGRRIFLYHEGTLRIARPADGGLVVGPHLNGLFVRTTIDKAATKRAITALGGMVPRGRDFARDDIESAMREAEELGTPLCLKPVAGEQGQLVFTGVTGMEEARRCFSRIGARFARTLIEEEVRGATYRFFYLRPSVVAIARQDPPLVVGNGRHSLAELLERFNGNHRRRDHPDYPPIFLDQPLLEWLGSLGLRLDEIPEAGHRIRVAAPAAWTAENCWIDATDAIHPSYGAVAAALCNGMAGLLIGGIDMVIADPDRPARPGNHWFLEINSSPNLHDHHHPWDGASRDVTGILVDRLLQAT